jgi:hypothetical protein
MFEVTKSRSRTLPYRLFLLLLALSAFGYSQDRDEDKDRDAHKEAKKAEATNPNFVKVEGKLRCEKPDPVHSIDVPDRPGHALIIAERRCTWMEPMEFQGGKTKDSETVSFIEKMEGTLHVHGFETSTLDNGEKLTWQSMGQVLAEKGPATAKGRWSLMRGTGKLKGIKGGGTYEGKLDADESLTLEFDGVFDPTELAGTIKSGAKK